MAIYFLTSQVAAMTTVFFFYLQEHVKLPLGVATYKASL